MLQQATNVQQQTIETTARNDRPSNQKEGHTNEIDEETKALEDTNPIENVEKQHKIPARPPVTK